MFDKLCREMTETTWRDVARALRGDKYKRGLPAGQEIDGEQLDSLVTGALILGAEPMDYPLTDGIIFYIRLPAGDVVALTIETDIEEPAGGGLYEVLRIRKAPIETKEAADR